MSTKKVFGIKVFDYEDSEPTAHDGEYGVLYRDVAWHFDYMTPFNDRVVILLDDGSFIVGGDKIYLIDIPEFRKEVQSRCGILNIPDRIQQIRRDITKNISIHNAGRDTKKVYIFWYNRRQLEGYWDIKFKLVFDNNWDTEFNVEVRWYFDGHTTYKINIMDTKNVIMKRDNNTYHSIEECYEQIALFIRQESHGVVNNEH